MYVDHAPYDGGQYGEHIIKRALKNPNLSFNIIASLFSSAAVDLTLQDQDAGRICLGAALIMIYTTVHNCVASYGGIKYFPDIKDIIIDRKDSSYSDGRSILAVENYYRIEKVNSAYSFAVMESMAAGLDIVTDSPLAKLCYGVGLSSCLVRFGWNAVALHQIRHGKWSVAERPSLLQNSKQEPCKPDVN